MCHRNSRLLSWLLFCLSLVGVNAVSGCSDEDDSGGNGTLNAQSMNSSDFERASLSPMERSDVVEEMEDFDWHENQAESSQFSGGIYLTKRLRFPSFDLRRFKKFGLQDEGTGNEFLDCAFADDSSVLRAVGDRFWWKFSTNEFGKCMEVLLGDSIQNLRANISFSGYVSQTCPGADYTALDGIKFSEFMTSSDSADKISRLEQVKDCETDDNTIAYEFKMAMGGTISGDLSFGETSRPFHMTIATKEATMSSAGGECRYIASAGEITVEDCEHYSLATSVTSSDDQTQESNEIVKATSTGVKGRVVNGFLTAGEMPVEVNNWKGHVTLDGSAYPGYLLRKGEETIAGKVGRSFGEVDYDDNDTVDEDSYDEYEPPKPEPKYSFPAVDISTDAEVHYLGAYESEEGNINVDIDRPGKPLIVVLASYEKTDFNLTIAEGTVIELIIVSGYETSQVFGIPSTVPVFRSSYDDEPYLGDGMLKESKFPYFYAYRDDSEMTYELDLVDGEWQCTDLPNEWHDSDWQEAVETVREATGKEITTAQGIYSTSLYTIDDSTTGMLASERESGRCYKEPDGTIVRHNWDFIGQ